MSNDSDVRSDKQETDQATDRRMDTEVRETWRKAMEGVTKMAKDIEEQSPSYFVMELIKTCALMVIAMCLFFMV